MDLTGQPRHGIYVKPHNIVCTQHLQHVNDLHLLIDSTQRDETLALHADTFALLAH